MSNRGLIEEALRRRGIVEACFPKQREPVEGALKRGERQIAILTSRRAGKTNTVLRAICRDALDHPNRKYAYIGLSRVTAENIVWKELEDINEAHNLRLELQGYRLRAIFPNGADITLYGADQPGWLKKFKGAKYRGVVIDEAGEYDIDLQDFIFRVIRPTLVDLQGTLWLIGTPGVVPSGYWWSVANPDPQKRERGWNLYKWHSFDNPFIVEQFKNDMDELREIYGEELEHIPWYRREWLGEWCFDASRNVYKYDPERNNIDTWERALGDQYILAIDPGYGDSAAFVVGSYNREKDDKLVFIDCFRSTKMLMDEMCDKAEEFIHKYPGIQVIGDYDAAHFMAEMRDRRRIPIQDAKKQKKQQAIEVMNNYLMAGKIKFLTPDTIPVAKEMASLQKVFRKSTEHKEDGILRGEWAEDPKAPNDLCDCALYITRHALQWTYKEPEPAIEPGSDEYYDKISNKLKEQALRRAAGDKPWWRKL